MKIKSSTTELRGVRAVRFTARIYKSKKRGIEKVHQKTWSFPTCAPEFTQKEMLPSIEKEAQRWERRILDRLERERRLAEEIKIMREEVTPPASPA